MKPLLLLLILCPVILSAQPQQKNPVDSNDDEAVANLKAMAASMSNDKCANVADIRVFDNGDYRSIVIFRHVITALDSAGPYRKSEVFTPIPLRPVVTFRISIPVTTTALITTAPRLPRLAGETVAMLSTRPVVMVKTSAPVILSEPITSVPRLPRLPEEIIAALTARPAIMIKTGAPVVPAEPITSVPKLPRLPEEIIAALTSRPVVLLRTGVAVIKAEHVTTPPELPLLPDDIITPVATHPVILLKTNITVTKVELMTSVPQLPVLEEEIRMPVAEMHLSPRGYSLLQKMEGFSSDLYALGDGGFTIGFGIFVPFNEGAKWNKGVTWDEAEQIMRQKMPVYEDQVKQYINIPLTQSEFDALTMLAYNLGGFSKATSIVNDVNEQVSLEQLEKDWKRFIHSKAPNMTRGLLKRRNDELDVTEISNYQPERKIQILKSRR